MSGTINGKSDNSIAKKPRYRHRTNPYSHSAQLKMLRTECPKLKRIITMGVYLELSEYIDDIGKILNARPAGTNTADVIERTVKGAKALTSEGDKLINKILFLEVKNQAGETVSVKDLLTACFEIYNNGLIKKEEILINTLKDIAQEKKTAAKLRTFCLAHSREWNSENKAKHTTEKKAPVKSKRGAKEAKPEKKMPAKTVTKEGIENAGRRCFRPDTGDKMPDMPETPKPRRWRWPKW